MRGIVILEFCSPYDPSISQISNNPISIRRNRRNPIFESLILSQNNVLLSEGRGREKGFEGKKRNATEKSKDLGP